MSKKWFVKSTGLIVFASVFNKVFGFIRDLVLAPLFGTSMAAQAFIVAFRIPNILRSLVGEGATNSAILPVLTEYYSTKTRKEHLHLFRVLLNAASATLLIISALGIICAPIIVRLIAPGFVNEPGTFRLTVLLTRIMFPYLFFIGLTAFFMGALNSQGHFATPAFAHSLLNISLILSLFFLCPSIGVFGLAVGVLIGGILQVTLNVFVAHKRGLTLNVKNGFRHDAAKRVGKLLLPRIAATAVYQINIIVDTMLASLAWIVGPGGVAGLYFANRLIQFPLVIFGGALAQVSLLKMAREAARNDIGQLKETILFALKTGLLVMVPASFGYIVLREHIVRILFERGEFNAYSTLITQNALFFYSFGLWASFGVKIMVTCFFALQDTITPVKTAGKAVLLNVALNFILIGPLKLGGLALATSIAAMFNFCMLFYILKKKIGGPSISEIVNHAYKIIIAGGIMAFFCWMLTGWFPMGRSYAALHNIRQLSIIIMCSIAVYAFSSLLLGVREVKDFLRWILRKR